MSKQKRRVRERYGAIARGPRQGCCGGSECCEPAVTAAERIGYTPHDLASAPSGANLGLGCGNPVALAAIAPGETVLDLGCGAGLDVFLAAERVRPTGRVVGVDMTPGMIEAARANAAAGGYSNVEFRLGDIEELPVEDASVDLVISNCVLNLAPDKARAFREICRVLKPGGRVAISDIVLDGALPESLEGSEEGYCACISGAAGRSEYLAMMAAAGIEDVQIVSAAEAAPILAGECCGGGVGELDLSGVATSISVTGRKAGGRGGGV